MTEKEWGFLYLLHSLSLDYVTCFPQLFSLFLALNAHSHLFSEPQSTKTLLLCRISDESTTSSYSYLSADLVNNRQRKCVNLVILLLNKRLSPHIHIYTHTHTLNLLTPCCHPWLCWVTQSTSGQCLHPKQSTLVRCDWHWPVHALCWRTGLWGEGDHILDIWLRSLNTDQTLIKHCFCRTAVITIFPLSGCRVDDAKKLVIGHSLWVKVRPHRSALHVLIGPLEWPHHLTLSGACVPNHKHGVTHRQQLLQLHHLTHTYRMKLFILWFVYITWRTLMTWYTNKHGPFYRIM